MNSTYIIRLLFFIFFTCTTISALTTEDIYHNNRELFYANPTAGEIKIKTRKNSAKKAYIVTNLKSINMNLMYQDEYFDYFVVDVGPFDTTLLYNFVVRDDIDSVVFPPANKLRPPPQFFITPDWAQNKTYYLIFADGFKNMDIINDPPGVRSWGTKPQGRYSYGGDLKGIINATSYLDSIDCDIVVLGPLFTSPSNHKFDFTDFGAIDPAFGDTAVLRILINELHKMNKKVVLMMIFTHTGTGFPAFADIMKNGTESKYINWYLIKSAPIKISSAYYECWRDDPRFPKLNLKEPQVKNFLLGYLEYWRQYGFDGFYIADDPLINYDFVKDLRSYVKSRYPNLLLIGTDNRSNTGDCFDGSWNTRFTELLAGYFGTMTVTTSLFDREIRRMLFWNPPQANMINLLSPTTYDARIKSYVQGEDLKNLYAFIFTFCGSPLITYGDEVGMRDSDSLNLGSFPWNAANQDRNLFQTITKLIAIRKTNRQISSKYFYTLYVNDITRVYAFDRGGLITILNNGESPAYVELPAWDGAYFDLVNNEKVMAFQQQLKLSINPKTYRILRREF